MTDQPTTPASTERNWSKERWRAHREKLLDEALEESFPASDPPSIARSRND